MKKGSIKKIGETETHVLEVKRKGSCTEVKVKIADLDGEGEVMLNIWEPTKKTKETTVQVNSKKGNEKGLLNSLLMFL